MAKQYTKSIFAGVFIAIALILSNNVSNITNNLIGAITFSFGLYGILHYKLKLFTGEIGYIT